MARPTLASLRPVLLGLALLPGLGCPAPAPDPDAAGPDVGSTATPDVVEVILFVPAEEGLGPASERAAVIAERARGDGLVVDVVGDAPAELSIEADPARLAAFGLTGGDLERALEAATDGDLGGLEQTPILARPDGTVVRLGDVATLRERLAPRGVALLDGARGVVVRVAGPGAAAFAPPPELAEGFTVLRLPGEDEPVTLARAYPTDRDPEGVLDEHAAALGSSTDGARILIVAGARLAGSERVALADGWLETLIIAPSSARSALARRADAVPLLGHEVVVELRGADPTAVANAAARVAEGARAVLGEHGRVLVHPDPTARPTVRVEIDDAAAARLGIDAAALAAALASRAPRRVALAGGRFVTLSIGSDDEAEPSRSPDDLARSPVATASGGFVPLAEVAALRMVSEPAFPVEGGVAVARVRAFASAGAAAELIQRLESRVTSIALPDGVERVR